jgi:hypothetical protein
MSKNTSKPKDTRPEAVARMIDPSDDPITPSIRCPFSYKGELCIGGMRRARLPIQIDMRVLPIGLGGPRVESTVVVF